jgi:flagellar hook-associated protein 3 FlgL
MTMVSIGDLARNLMLQRHLTATKGDLARLSESLATGRHADQAAQGRGDLGPLAAIEGVLARLDAWRTVTAALSGRLAVQQSSLGALQGIAESQASGLLRLGLATSGQEVSRAAADARQHLDAATAMLNARHADQTVFSGTRTDGPAVLDGEALLDVLWPVVHGALDADDARTRVLDWFDDPAGFSAVGYLGGGPKPAVAIGQETAAADAVTADDPAIRRTLAGLSMAALLDRGLFAPDPAQRRALAQMAGDALLSGHDERIHLAGDIGLAEQRLAAVESRNSAERTALGLARAAMISADPFAVASELEATRVQIETLYAVTARLSGLSLMGYLR